MPNASWLNDLDPLLARAWREIGWDAVLSELGPLLEQRGSGNARRPTSVSGRLIMSCCFHQERTPSLSLYPNGGFTCYGCGECGGIPDFVAELLGLQSLEQLEKFFRDLLRGQTINPNQQQFKL